MLEAVLRRLHGTEKVKARRQGGCSDGGGGAATYHARARGATPASTARKGLRSCGVYKARHSSRKKAERPSVLLQLTQLLAVPTRNFYLKLNYRNYWSYLVT